MGARNRKVKVNRPINAALKQASDRVLSAVCHCGEAADPVLRIECCKCYDALRAEIKALRAASTAPNRAVPGGQNAEDC
jgi:hypothetical protein